MLGPDTHIYILADKCTYTELQVSICAESEGMMESTAAVTANSGARSGASVYA